MERRGGIVVDRAEHVPQPLRVGLGQVDLLDRCHFFDGDEPGLELGRDVAVFEIVQCRPAQFDQNRHPLPSRRRVEEVVLHERQVANDEPRLDPRGKRRL